MKNLIEPTEMHGTSFLQFRHALRKMMLVAALFLTCSRLDAQFIAATVSENGTNPGYITGVHNTGNDIKTPVANTGLTVMAVNVWDGNTPGLGWDDHNSHVGFMALNQNDAYDPDVTLVEDGTTWWAVVVYYSGHAGYVCDFYEWDGTSSFNPVGTGNSYTTVLSSSSFGTAINIDGDEVGDFAIVWDEPGNDIQAIVGSTYLSAIPSLCSSAVSLGSSTYNFIEPDVAIQTNGDPANSGIHYVFLRPSRDRMYILFDKWGATCSGTPYLYYDYQGNIQLYGEFHTPRIAAPPPYTGTGTGTEFDYAVAVEEYNPYYGTDDIRGITRYCMSLGCNATFPLPAPYLWTYTDGSGATHLPHAINGYANQKPAISYSISAGADKEGIIVAWESSNSGTSPFVPSAPIAIQCDITGDYFGYYNCYPNSNYMIVPYNNPNNSSFNEDIISISGRDYTDMMYTFAETNSSIDDIYWKTVPFTYCGLRHSRLVSTSPIALFPNPVYDEFSLNIETSSSDEIINMQITDVTGKQIICYKGTLADINNHSAGFVQQLSRGIYILHLLTRSQNKSLQLVKM